MHLKNVLGQIKAHSLYCHWVAPFLSVDNNCTLARSMQVEQEPSTSSVMGRPHRSKVGLSVGREPKVTDAASGTNDTAALKAVGGMYCQPKSVLFAGVS